ncbi:MAG: NPCBM/NEW2 domain-containing protein, partial [Candidatus Nanopelagicales bacterium]
MAGAPKVSTELASCKLTVTQSPPDASAGWRVQFRRDGGTAIGNRDSSPPYSRTTTLPVGDYLVWAEWSKPDGTLRLSEKVSVSCRYEAVIAEIPWTVTPPPPDPEPHPPPPPDPEPPPSPPDPTVGLMLLGNYAWRSMTNGWGPAERNRSNGEQGAADGGPIRIRGQQFATGIGC